MKAPVFVIRDTLDKSYLHEGSKSRGSVGGIARIWSTEARQALRFTSRAEAQAFADREFAQDYERDSYYIEAA
jgi:hypothetical protein